MSNYKIFLIAGEASGDLLGSKLMQALKKLSTQNISFYGIGGERMTKEGLTSLFPMKELSVMGFIEIIPHLPKLINYINFTAQEIKTINPDIVITIDSPDFCFRVAKKVKKLVKLIHYVAPSVWAYRPKRAKKIAKIYDHLLALLPFEPPYFKDEGLSCTFIGHPIVEDIVTNADGNEFRKKYNIKTEDIVLCIMPGSRKGEVKRLLPIFMEAAELISKKIPNLVIVIPTIPAIASFLKEKIIDKKYLIISEQKDKSSLYKASNIALVKSGTGTFEVAAYEIPMVVAYKINPITAFFLKLVIKIPYFNLINLIQGKEIIPEFMQEKCTAENLANSLFELLNNNEIKSKQINASKEAFKTLGLDTSPTPSEKAAQIVINMLK